jgi:hypothetical protein
MNKPLIGLLASGAFMLCGVSTTVTADQPSRPSDNLGDWASAEGYKWAKAHGEIVFCRREVVTGSHTSTNKCVNYQNLVARWEEWKNPTTMRGSLSTPPSVQQGRAPGI